MQVAVTWDLASAANWQVSPGERAAQQGRAEDKKRNHSFVHFHRTQHSHGRRIVFFWAFQLRRGAPVASNLPWTVWIFMRRFAYLRRAQACAPSEMNARWREQLLLVCALQHLSERANILFLWARTRRPPFIGSKATHLHRNSSDHLRHPLGTSGSD